MIEALILGCGSSGGIPRLGNRWGDCDPTNPKNRRRRCSLLLQRSGKAGTTRVLIDTGPDMVSQLLDAEIGELDAVLYTHGHADHTHGIDDLRQIAYNLDQVIPVWADNLTADGLLERFNYIFETPPGSYYPPVARLNLIKGPVRIDGAGGPLLFTPFQVKHGSINALGFRIEAADSSRPPRLVYLPDVSDIPDAAWPVIEDCDVFICDALRRKPHPSHAHLELTVEWILRSRARHGVITNMHLDMDYQAVMRDTPDHVVPAHDGMVIRLI